MGLKLLHLSDIHFRTFDGKEFKDLDTDIQNELQLDLKSLRRFYNEVDLILIGGDIAFSGIKDEYEKADKWIKKIAETTGCREDFVFTVPGNHDVDRSKISLLLKDTQRDIKRLGADRVTIDNKIQGYLNSSDIAYLLKPFENYNIFAQKYGSTPEEGNLLFWEQSFKLDGLLLKIRGVNSAIVSNGGDNDTDAKLVLGSHQSVMPRQPGVINLILCHHPPSWLCDGEQAHGDFKNRARIHLFGHKHVFEATLLENRCLVLAAGAMQPSRNESDWEPTYNIIDLSVQRANEQTILVVKLYRRTWDKGKGKFGPDFKTSEPPFQEYRLDLDEVESELVERIQDPQAKLTEPSMSEPIINIDEPNHLRKLAYLFLGLPYHVRLSVAVALQLVEENDEELSDLQKAQEYFKRAIQKNKLAEMWDLVMENVDEKQINPFKK